MTGNEHFFVNNQETSMTMDNFWKWAYSDLSDSINRSMLSEYIVASALSCSENRCSTLSKKGYDVLTKEGMKISVKSAAYVQSNDASKPDCVSFSISSSIYNERNSDAYVFCLYKGICPSDSPLNLDLWEFFVLSTNVLNSEKQNQKTITLYSLMKLEPIQCNYNSLEKVVHELKEEMLCH